MSELFTKLAQNVELLMDLTNGFPEKAWTYVVRPFLGRNYDPRHDHDIYSVEFHWREVFHFLGGAVQGGLWSFLYLLLPNLLAALLPIIGVAIAIGIKEFFGDAAEQVNGWDFKNVVDTVVWTIGTASVSLGIYFLVK